jgi:uracil-DNA glycosylase family 4
LKNIQPRQPDTDCALCPRLKAFRDNNRVCNPSWHNSPVLSFGEISCELLIVGLAPGLRGANKTGRPFTGDHAGDFLYNQLSKFGFSKGEYKAEKNDGLVLKNCRITNAVRCVPPENKPLGAEVLACSTFLGDEIASLSNLRIILALGTLAHGVNGKKIILADSYHCSRYNTNTKRLTESMFESVFEGIFNQLS